MRDRWTDEGAADAVRKWGHILGPRTYTSRLVGADPGLVLHGGGNTSVKGTVTNVLGERVEALFVKGSGWDLATIEPAGFATVDLAFLRRMRALDALSDEDMVDALKTHLLRAAAPGPSIETLLHAFLPHRYVDHSHADAILGLTNLDEGAAVVRRALGPDVAIVPYVKAGFELAKVAAQVHDERPGCVGMVLLHHGLFTWGDSAKESYQRHIDLVDRAERFLRDAGARATYLPPLRDDSVFHARERAARVAPRLRGAIARAMGRSPILDYRCDDALLAAINAPQLAYWVRSGPLTPDHVIRTKPEPLVVLQVDPDADADDDVLDEGLRDAVARYVERYEAYFERCATAAGGVAAYRRLDPAPRVVWFPGVGLFGVGATAREARIAADISEHTLLLKQRAEPLGAYLGLDEQALFEMEYWSLEQAKLGRGASPLLAGRVALITGAAGAIGVGVARQLVAAGAHVVLTDRDEPALARAVAALGGPSDQLASVPLDVADADSVAAGFAEACRRFGGVDLVVANAGVAIGGALSLLTDDDLARAVDVNLGGTLRTLRAAAHLFEAQRLGGDVVVVSTKNVAAPGAELGAYSATKAAAHQLGRVAALELATLGVRVNMVAPDAVFAEGEIRSGLWQGLGADRARARGMDPAELPAFYRERNLLKAEVTGSDVGHAVVFLASGLTPTTGAVLPVDGGLAAAFPR